MGRQIIILGASGSFDINHALQLTTLAGTLGLQVLHASIFYDGDKQQHFAVGGPGDLSEDLAKLIGTAKLEFVPAELAMPGGIPEGSAAAGPQVGAVTLETIRGHLEALEKKLDSFVRYEKRDDKAKTPKAEKKKGAAEDLQKPGAETLGLAGTTSTDGANGQGLGGTQEGGTAPAGAPVGTDGKPPEPGDLPAGAEGSEEKAGSSDEGAKKEEGTAEDPANAAA